MLIEQQMQPLLQLHHVVVGGDDQLVVDADLAELVDDDRGPESLLVGQDMIQQRGLAAAEEAGDDGHGQARVRAGMEGPTPGEMPSWQRTSCRTQRMSFGASSG